VTGRDLVSASLRLIGAIAPGETLAAREATDGLASLNRMLDSWSNERLLIPATSRESFTLTSGTGTYTLGSGGTLSTTRPLHISQALIRDESVSPALEYPVAIRSLAQWNEIPAKDQRSTYPREMYADGAVPLSNVSLYPVPTGSSLKLILCMSKPLTTLTDLDDELDLAPGYERAIIYNFAIEISPEYGKAVPDAVVKVATESKGSLKRTNYKPGYLKVDSAISAHGKFNILTGDYR
jgi:hypothetical protein